MIDLEYYIINLLFFDIPLLYCYINLRSSIIFYLSSGDIYFSLSYSFSCSFLFASELFSSKHLEALVILPSCDLTTASAILFPIRSLVASAAF